MGSINAWINTNAQILSFFSTTGLVIITTIYVIFTYQILRQSNRPYIQTTIADEGPHAIRLIIKNTGNRQATNIKFELDGEYESTLKGLDGGTELPNQQPFRSGISGLSPDQSRSYFFEFDGGKWDGDRTQVFLKYNMQYAFGRRSFEESFETRLEDFHMALVGDRNNFIKKISDSLEKIESAMARKNIEPIHFRTTKKVCPNCQELIANRARKCRYCLEFLPELGTPLDDER